ncbi:MAG: phospho-N-acetylmuramoyl-pentapeptide-transferase [Corynebacterium sp.]|nr:phospho-N-acetylmuramoyl-pentapeptide-transferase [Corynebacterium sp.]
MIQVLLAWAIGFIVALGLTKFLIRRFSAVGIGQEIREDGPSSHLRKRGTPTMGGIAIICGIVTSYVLVNLGNLIADNSAFTASGLLVLFLTIGLGFVGFLDDYLKIRNTRNLGLNKTGKLIGQLAIAIIFGLLALHFPDRNDLTPASTHLSFIRDIAAINFQIGPVVIGTIIFLVFMYFLIAAWSNAVNLTDGLDGLAAGATVIVMSAYTFITFFQYQNSCAQGAADGCYEVRDPHDLSILAAAALGAALGFLFWNAAPAKIFMGDTGSLALGGLVAGLSVTTRTELLMIIIGLIFVVEVTSVAIQIVVFRSTGKRFFRMAPLHHHFENGGWQEINVVVRFWIFTIITTIIGMAIFYGEWLATTGSLS